MSSSALLFIVPSVPILLSPYYITFPLLYYFPPTILHLTPYHVNPINHPPPPHPQNHPFHHPHPHCCFQPQQAEQEFPPSGLSQGSPRKSQPLRRKEENGGTYLILCNMCRPSTSSCHWRMTPPPQSTTQRCQHAPIS